MRGRIQSEYLFSTIELHGLLEGLGKGLKSEIDREDRNYLLNVSEEDYCAHLIDKYTLEAPVINDDDIVVEVPQDAKINVRGRFDYVVFDRDKDCFVDGVSVTVRVPFTGDGQHFHIGASAYNLSSLRANIIENTIVLSYSDVKFESKNLQDQVNKDIAEIKRNLVNLSNNFKNFNDSLKTSVPQLVQTRKRKILEQQNLVSSLGIKLVKSDETPKTYSVPTERRRPEIIKPTASTTPFKPEPALSDEDYKFILEVINSFAISIERSPQAFVGMDEETLRFQLLLNLNTHFKGIAMAEAFNKGGKTDILMRHEEKNVFIAECKIWAGEGELTKAIDQLFRYTCWRDTKTGIIVFNRNKDFTAVLQKIKEAVEKHPCFKKHIGDDSETQFKYLFHQSDDKNRELILTVLAFNVPT